jgi:hypothetical protein
VMWWESNVLPFGRDTIRVVAVGADFHGEVVLEIDPYSLYLLWRGVTLTWVFAHLRVLHRQQFGV